MVLESSGTVLVAWSEVLLAATGVGLTTLELALVGSELAGSELAGFEVLVALEAGFGGTTMASVVTARGSGAPLVKSSKLPADLMLAFFADDFAGFKTFVGSSITVLAFCSG